MKIVVSADEYCPVIDTLLEELKKRGHDAIYFGPKKGEEALDWTTVTLDAVHLITSRKADEGIVCCWTGTGATLIANKMKGIRAALCGDGETAAGARKWNHANLYPNNFNNWFFPAPTSPSLTPSASHLST